MLDRFVCVRVVQMWGADLSLFQFHGQLTWAAFMLNADRTVYGRYGSRGPRRGRNENEKDVSIAGFKEALEGALELHAGFPGNRDALAGKGGSKPPVESPEKFVAAEVRQAKRAEEAAGKGCIHCHQIQDWTVPHLRAKGLPIEDRVLWTYPMPDTLGLAFDVDQRATVAKVRSGSTAEKAGFRAGDRLLSLGGQPLVSIADVQWVLHQSPEPSTLKAKVARGTERVDLDLPLAAGWRRAFNFADTLSLGWSAGLGVAGFRCSPLAPAEKKSLGLEAGALGLRVSQLAPDWLKERNPSPKKAGLRKDDVIVSLDGMKASMSESEFLAWLCQRKKPGETIALGVLRNGAIETVSMTVP